MARPKTFDQQEVLEKAMAAFWQRGYEATSMNDLVEVMGIHRGSLYSTFGDKQTLFKTAIAHYYDTVVQDATSGLRNPASPKQAIIEFFRGVAHHAAVDPFRRGCMITNTVIEFGEEHPEISPKLAQDIEQIEDLLCKTVMQAQEMGEIAPEKDAGAIAQFLFTVLQGIRVMSKINPNEEKLMATVNLALAVLDS